MHTDTGNRVIGRLARRLGGVRHWRRDEKGSTAIEFAIVATPFLMFIFGLIGVAFYFFIMSSVEKGMDQSSRLIRTGQAVTAKMTVDQFKKNICSGAGQWIRCDQLQVFVQHYADWMLKNPDGTVGPKPCVNASGVAATNPANGGDLIATYSGSASDIVIVAACYRWTFTQKLPFLNLGNMKDRAMMMQSATAFRSEPFPGT